MDLKAVVFDFGKVISFPPPAGVMEELAALAGLDLETMDALVWKHRDEYDRGTVSAREYYRHLLSQGGVWPGDESVEKMIRIDLDSWKNLNPGTVKLMEDVKARGYKLGILSNMPHDFLDFARKNFPVFKLPDAGIFSCEVGAVKPEAAIYQALLAALGCAGGEVVFFDDLRRNIEKARDFGIRSFLWEDPGAARNELRALGLSI